jgi:hypothetical protein
MSLSRHFLLFGMIILGAAVADGRVWEIPTDASSITSGLDLASSGDTVSVAPGLYLENELIMPDGVTLLGDPENPGNVIVDGQWGGGLLRCDDSSYGTVITGLTFRHGLGISLAPVSCIGGSPIFRFCHFRENMSGVDGGAVNVTDSQTTFEDCLFDTNQSGVSAGGALVCRRSTTFLSRCVFRNNLSLAWGGALYISGSSDLVLLDKCLFENNSGLNGGAVSLNGAAASMRECEFNHNSGSDFGGAFSVQFGGRMTVEDSRYEGNSSAYGKIGFVGSGSTCGLICIDTDHGLVIGAGTISWDDEGCDYVANEALDWGAVKRLYR